MNTGNLSFRSVFNQTSDKMVVNNDPDVPLRVSLDQTQMSMTQRSANIKSRTKEKFQKVASNLNLLSENYKNIQL